MCKQIYVGTIGKKDRSWRKKMGFLNEIGCWVCQSGTVISPYIIIRYFIRLTFTNNSI